LANETAPKSRRLNALDFSIVIIIFLAAIGFGLARAGYAGVDKVIQGIQDIDIDVYIVGLKSLDGNLFKVGEKSALTIRNQPVYPPMTISNVKVWPRQVSFMSPDGKKAVAFSDPTQPFARDYVISVTDQAEVTKDGYVVRGNKIKVGNLVELESFKYRVQGVVLDIRPHQ
jgi:hypothetical protein